MSWTNTEKSKLGDSRNVLTTYSEDVEYDGKVMSETTHMNVMGYSRVTVSVTFTESTGGNCPQKTVILLGSLDGINFYPLTRTNGHENTILVSHHDLAVRFVKVQFAAGKEKNTFTNITLYAST